LKSRKNHDRTYLNTILSHCRRVIRKIKKSPTNLAAHLLQLQTDLQNTLYNDDDTDPTVESYNQTALKGDNDTRWNSTLRMISSINKWHTEINQVLYEYNDENDCFHDDELNVLRELEILLKPIERVSRILEAGTTPTLSLCYSSIYWLKGIYDGTIVEPKHNLNQITSNEFTAVRNEIRTQIQNRFTSIHSETESNARIYAMATMLDPRTKSCHNLPEEIKNKFEKIFADNYKLFHDSINASTAHESPDEFSKDSNDDLFGASVSSVTTEPLENELQTYMNVKTISAKDCPLSWWKEHESHYPIMSQLARRYLCIPASSASSERLWSISGHLVTKYRNRLNGDTICGLMFLKRNSFVMKQLGLKCRISKVTDGVRFHTT
jgi:hypothetical protein